MDDGSKIKLIASMFLFDSEISFDWMSGARNGLFRWISVRIENLKYTWEKCKLKIS